MAHRRRASRSSILPGGRRPSTTSASAALLRRRRPWRRASARGEHRARSSRRRPSPPRGRVAAGADVAVLTLGASCRRRRSRSTGRAPAPPVPAGLRSRGAPRCRRPCSPATSAAAAGRRVVLELECRQPAFLVGEEDEAVEVGMAGRQARGRAPAKTAVPIRRGACPWPLDALAGKLRGACPPACRRREGLRDRMSARRLEGRGERLALLGARAAERKMRATPRRPSVRVPVLSSTTSVTRVSASSARPFVSSTPCASSAPLARVSTIGAASASAQGHATTSTAIATQASPMTIADAAAVSTTIHVRWRATRSAAPPGAASKPRRARRGARSPPRAYRHRRASRASGAAARG